MPGRWHIVTELLYSQVCCIQFVMFKYIVLMHIALLHNSTEFKNEFVGWQGSEVKRESTVIHNRTQGEHIIAH